MVSNLKSETNKNAKLLKLKESIKEKEEEFENLEKMYENLKKQEEEKTYVIKIEEDNIKLKKKIISV